MDSSRINKKRRRKSKRKNHKDKEATWFMSTSSSSTSCAAAAARYSNRSVFRSFDKVSLKGSFSPTRPFNKDSRRCMPKRQPLFAVVVVDFAVVVGAASIAITRAALILLTGWLKTTFLLATLMGVGCTMSFNWSVMSKDVEFDTWTWPNNVNVNSLTQLKMKKIK